MSVTKKGVTPMSIVLIVVVMVILLSTITIKAVNIVDTLRIKKVANEFFQVEKMTNEYNQRKSGNHYFETVTLEVSSFNPEQAVSYAEETVTSGTITLYQVDLSTIDATKTRYGNLSTPTDRYLYSIETGRIYYEEGAKAGNKTYYTLTNRLKSYL